MQRVFVERWICVGSQRLARSSGGGVGVERRLLSEWSGQVDSACLLP